MKPLRLGLGRCLLALAVWLILTVGIPLHGGAASHAPLWQSVSGGIGWSWMLAALFGLGLVLASGRHALGLRLPVPIGAWRIAWLPFAYAAAACMLAAAGRPLPGGMVAMVLLNTSLVALSEEVMFRGILLHGLMTRLGVLPAVLASSALFGAVHALNALTTGDLATSLCQALAAALQGVGFAAVRLRTGSLWPMIAAHALYDCGLLLLAARTAPAAGLSVAAALGAILLVVPVMFYGLFLLRKQAGPGALPTYPERFN